MTRLAHPTSGGFTVVTARGAIGCRHVVLATGGESLPKSGSDGAGFQFAQRLGHTIVPTTPALVPLVLDEAATPRSTASCPASPTTSSCTSGSTAGSPNGSTDRCSGRISESAVPSP